MGSSTHGGGPTSVGPSLQGCRPLRWVAINGLFSAIDDSSKIRDKIQQVSTLTRFPTLANSDYQQTSFQNDTRYKQHHHTSECKNWLTTPIRNSLNVKNIGHVSIMLEVTSWVLTVSWSTYQLDYLRFYIINLFQKNSPSSNSFPIKQNQTSICFILEW